MWFAQAEEDEVLCIAWHESISIQGRGQVCHPSIQSLLLRYCLLVWYMHLCGWARVYTCALHVRFPEWWYHVIPFLKKYIALFSSLLFAIDKSNNYNTLNSGSYYVLILSHIKILSIYINLSYYFLFIIYFNIFPSSTENIWSIKMENKSWNVCTPSFSPVARCMVVEFFFA